ncbi:MAG TPA: hypothetical protein VLK65_13845 [Vicinamibacteria bacterium]|nr:hypothetical protein [Vicinamibacteria bacterium]
MRLVVTDTGPLLHLAEAKSLEILRWVGEVHIPLAVNKEMAQLENDWESARPAWVHVTSVAPPHSAEALNWEQSGLLDHGESEAIALARQLSASWFLTDDTSARLVAHSLGIEAHGSLGIILWTAAEGHLTRAEAESALTRLSQSSLWLSERILGEARKALDQLSG